MCGRFTLSTNLTTLRKLFQTGPASIDIPPRYNIAPAQTILTVIGNEPHRFLEAEWGIPPFWKSSGRIINARIETLHEKPMFREPLKQDRCLIPSDGFFEWKQAKNKKQPWYFHLENRRPFAFAGILMHVGGKEKNSFAAVIITTEAFGAVTDIHHRMPMVLKPSGYSKWLDFSIRDPLKSLDILLDHQETRFQFHPVSSRVNSVKNDHPDCIKPLEPVLRQIPVPFLENSRK